MKNTESPERVMARLLRKVVAYAGALGELKYRHSLIADEIKQIDLVDRSYARLLFRSASLERKAGETREPAALALRRDYRRSIREQSKYLSRTRFLLQEEWEQIGRLRSEMEMQLAETIIVLKKSRGILQ